jgi:hypothetical protein
MTREITLEMAVWHALLRIVGLKTQIPVQSMSVADMVETTDDVFPPHGSRFRANCRGIGLTMQSVTD